MREEHIEINYPFCNNGKIQAWHIPSFWQVKRSVTATFSGRRNLKRTKDIWIIKSGGNVCNKSQEEVKRELKKEGFL